MYLLLILQFLQIVHNPCSTISAYIRQPFKTLQLYVFYKCLKMFTIPDRPKRRPFDRSSQQSICIYFATISKCSQSLFNNIGVHSLALHNSYKYIFYECLKMFTIPDRQKRHQFVRTSQRSSCMYFANTSKCSRSLFDNIGVHSPALHNCPVVCKAWEPGQSEATEL